MVNSDKLSRLSFFIKQKLTSFVLLVFLFSILISLLGQLPLAFATDKNYGPLPRPKPNIAPDPNESIVIKGDIHAYGGKKAKDAKDGSPAPRLNKNNLKCIIKANPSKKVDVLIQATEEIKSGGYRLLVQIPDGVDGCGKPGESVWIYYGTSTKSHITLKGDQRKDKPDNPEVAEVDTDTKADTQNRDDKIIHATMATIPPVPVTEAQRPEPSTRDDADQNVPPDVPPSVDEIANQSHEKEYPNEGFDRKKSESVDVQVDALPKLEHKLKEINNKLNDPNCNDCKIHSALPPQWHETCKKGLNDYLEKRIPSVNDLLEIANTSPNLQKNDPNMALPKKDEDFRECVYLSMTKFADAPDVKYGACNDKNSGLKGPSRIQTHYLSGGKKKRPNIRPCASEKNVDSVATAFEVASECMGINKKEIFALINHESGFNSNAVSSTGCAGIGQLCGAASAIADINQKSFKDMYNELRNGTPKCQALANRIQEQMAHNPAASCERIAKTNSANQWVHDPTRNIFYSLLYYRNNKTSAAAELNKISNFKNIKGPLKNDILTAITFLQHNGGPGKVLETAKVFFKKYKTFVNLKEFFSSFDKHINSSSNPTPLRREVKNYLGKILEDLKKINGVKHNCSSWPSST